MSVDGELSFEHEIGIIKGNKENAENGKVNCIPSPFKSFQTSFPGIRKGFYYIVSGSTKSGKSQFTNYMFVNHPLFYAYANPEKVRVKIFYYALEESITNIKLRFMSYVLYTLSRQAVRVSPADLQSIREGKIVSDEVLSLLCSTEYQEIFKFFEDHVEFPTSRNPTGYRNDLIRYAESHGKEVNGYYVPDDKDEYVITVWDHAGLTAKEKNDYIMDKTAKGVIDKLDEYHMIMRNHYHYTPVLIMQQNSETISLDAFKANKIRPTFNGLSDSKNPGKGCSMMLGITNPYAFELSRYPNPNADGPNSYDITKLKDYARFLEVVLSREGSSNGLLPLYFDGAVNYFTPLPAAGDISRLKTYYDLIAKNKAS